MIRSEVVLPAAIAAVIALAAGVTLIATSDSGGAARVNVAPRPPAPAGAIFPHTPAGAVAAATAWCQNTGEAFFNGGYESAVSVLADTRMQALVKRLGEPLAHYAQDHIAAAHVPYLARAWPLGYAVQQYSATAARVRVWQVYALAIASPLDTTGFQTTTVSLAWLDDTWKVTLAPGGPNLTPPGENATPSQIDGWISAADQLRDYAYAP